MIKVENIETWGMEHSIRGMRNPMNSWNRSDSQYVSTGYEVGANDLELMQKLYKAGTEHRKYLRQIFISMDITAPLYWWKEFDTYKIGTTSNSCSTMHKITAKEFTLDDFSAEQLLVWGFEQNGDIDKDYIPLCVLQQTVNCLNKLRDTYNKVREEKGKEEQAISIWYNIIQLLPSSYNQKRTITMTYENAMSIINQRKGHKLDEWRKYVEILLQNVPYLKEIRGE